MKTAMLKKSLRIIPRTVLAIIGILISLVSFGYTDTILSHTQHFIIPENIDINDDCGKFYSIFTHETIEQIKFEIIAGNDDDIFKINSLTGDLQINDNILLNYNKKNKYSLIIKTVDGNLTDIDTAIIMLKDKDSCIFIDPGYKGTERGTRSEPYNSWNDIKSWKAGFAYLQKRGTVYGENEIRIPSPGGTKQKHIILGAYGRGRRPVLDGTTLENDEAGIYIGYFATPAGYIDVYSFIVHSSEGIGTGPATHHILINDCEVYNCVDNAGIYIYRDANTKGVKLYNKIYNTVSRNNKDEKGYHGIKLEGSKNEIINCHLYGNGRHGLQVAYHSSDNLIKYVYAHHNDDNGFNIAGDTNRIYNCIAHDDLLGFQFLNNSHNDIMANCKSYSNRWHGIGAYATSHNIFIEKNYTYNNLLTGIRLTVDPVGITIRQNKVFNNKTNGIQLDSHPKNVKINYNIIYDNSEYGINLVGGESISIDNNTIYNNSIKIENLVTDVLIRNNFTNNIIGTYSGSNNIINGPSSNYEDASARNFNLKEGVEAIDAGKDVGLKYDYSGNPILGNPDIGAFEFYKTQIREVNNPPVIFNKIFNVADSLPEGTYIGTISAVDYDTGQKLDYSIIDGNINNTFSLNSSTGDIIITDNTEFASLDSFCLTVEAKDDGLGNLSATAIVLINIISTDSPPGETQEIQNISPVIKNQVFYIKEEDKLDDFLVTVEANDPDFAQNLTFSIISGNEGNIFAINSINGNLTINDTSKLDFEESVLYSLNVAVQDDGEGNLTSSAMIKMITLPRMRAFYIDPTNTNDPLEDGTTDHPFDSWADVSWQEGNSYFQKRNTTANESKINVYANNVTLSAYGQGDNPVINSSATDFAVRVFEKTDVTIQNLKIIADEAISCIYFLGSSCDNNIIEKCYLEGANNGLRVIDGKTITLRYNTFANNSEAIYSYAETTKIYYNVFKENDTGVNVSSYLSSTEIYNNVFYDNSRGVSTSYSSLTIYNNIFYLMDQGDQAINHKLDNLVSDNNIFYPEQDGFLDIGDKRYSSLYDYQQSTSLDLNSFTSDPMFKDIYNNNFSVEPSSPAIDGGRDVGLLMDYYGYSVPSGRNPDIGLSELMDNAIISAVEPFFDDGGDGEAPLIFPNPSDGRFKISYSNSNFQTSELQIKDMAGALIYQDVIGSDEVDSPAQIDITSAPKGIYLVLLAIDDKIYTQRIVIN
jgi:parallel beta-helix repeat protein